jgi:hypothetical protein
MAFCTKCGGEVDKNWKHCPSCGQAVVKKIASSSSSSPTSKVPTPKEIRIQDNAVPVVKGIPQSSKRIDSLSPAIAAADKADPKGRTLIAFSIILVMILGIILGGNIGSDEESAVLDELPIEEVQVDPAVEQAKIDKANFYTSLTAFLDAGCKPEITKPGPEFSDVMADMELPGVQGIDDFPEKYNRQVGFGGVSVEDWGTPIEKALVVTAAYESKLSGLYWDVFDLFRSQSELGKYKTKFNQYFNKADNVAKKLCYKNGQPSESQLDAADKSLAALTDEWGDFNSWYEEVNARSQDLHAELDSYGKPICTETPTNLPGYNIVKCTNLP